MGKDTADNIALALMAMQLAQQAVPVLQNAFQSGEISIEKQKEVLDAYNALSDNLDAAFSGPQWQIDPDPVPEPEAHAIIDTAKEGPTATDKVEPS